MSQDRRLLNLQVFLSFDYSQIEIRELAELSGDKLLVAQFHSGQDIHCEVGHMLTGWDREKIAKNKEVRRGIKNFHFALVYGVGKDSIYEHLVSKGVKITRQRANQYYDRYFRTYKGVAQYIKDQRQKAERDGYVENLFGFRREIYQQDESRGTYWGNQAINTPVQGTAHHLLLIAIARSWRKHKTYSLLQKPVMEIHDALYWFTRLRDLPAAYHQGKHLLEDGVVESVARRFKYQLKVPLVAEGSAGFCLGGMVEYRGEPIEEFLAAWRQKHRESDKARLEFGHESSV